MDTGGNKARRVEVPGLEVGFFLPRPSPTTHLQHVANGGRRSSVALHQRHPAGTRWRASVARSASFFETAGDIYDQMRSGWRGGRAILLEQLVRLVERVVAGRTASVSSRTPPFRRRQSGTPVRHQPEHDESRPASSAEGLRPSTPAQRCGALRRFGPRSRGGRGRGRAGRDGPAIREHESARNDATPSSGSGGVLRQARTRTIRTTTADRRRAARDPAVVMRSVIAIGRTCIVAVKFVVLSTADRRANRTTQAQASGVDHNHGGCSPSRMGQLRRERPRAMGVTEEHLLGQKTGGFRGVAPGILSGATCRRLLMPNARFRLPGPPVSDPAARSEGVISAVIRQPGCNHTRARQIDRRRSFQTAA